MLARVVALLATHGDDDDEHAHSAPPVDMIDIDAVVEAHCREHGTPVPDDPDAKMQLHLAAVSAWLDSFDM